MSRKISVIVPVYKVENYIRQCVDSILAQSYTDLEILLVDDGSPDHCGEICDQYVQKDNRINVADTLTADGMTTQKTQKAQKTQTTQTT